MLRNAWRVLINVTSSYTMLIFSLLTYCNYQFKKFRLFAPLSIFFFLISQSKIHYYCMFHTEAFCQRTPKTNERLRCTHKEVQRNWCAFSAELAHIESCSFVVVNIITAWDTLVPRYGQIIRQRRPVPPLKMPRRKVRQVFAAYLAVGADCRADAKHNVIANVS